MLKAKAYLCGPTVHHSQHVGNYKTVYKSIEHFDKFKRRGDLMMMNITDISEKIYQKSGLRNEDVQAYVNEYTREFVNHLRNLELRPWRLLIKRTSSQLKVIKKDVKSIVDRYDHQITNSGVLYRPNQNQGFHLWRTGDNIAMYDSSFLGPRFRGVKGIPGWHNECFSLIKLYLKNDLVHYGGSDLAAIHHKNEKMLLDLVSPKRIEYYYSGTISVATEDGPKKISKSLENVPFEMNSLTRSGYQKLIKYFKKVSFRSKTVLKSSLTEDLFRIKQRINKRSRRRTVGSCYRRLNCKKTKDYVGADRIRNNLQKYNYNVTDLGSKFLLVHVRQKKKR